MLHKARTELSLSSTQKSTRKMQRYMETRTNSTVAHSQHCLESAKTLSTENQIQTEFQKCTNCCRLISKGHLLKFNVILSARSSMEKMLSISTRDNQQGQDRAFQGKSLKDKAQVSKPRNIRVEICTLMVMCKTRLMKLMILRIRQMNSMMVAAWNHQDQSEQDHSANEAEVAKHQKGEIATRML